MNFEKKSQMCLLRSPVEYTHDSGFVVFYWKSENELSELWGAYNTWATVIHG